jgi:hypothetical protein
VSEDLADARPSPLAARAGGTSGVGASALGEEEGQEALEAAGGDGGGGSDGHSGASTSDDVPRTWRMSV